MLSGAAQPCCRRFNSSRTCIRCKEIALPSECFPGKKCESRLGALWCCGAAVLRRVIPQFRSSQKRASVRLRFRFGRFPPTTNQSVTPSVSQPVRQPGTPSHTHTHTHTIRVQIHSFIHAFHRIFLLVYFPVHDLHNRKVI